jgi:dTDP-4-dehydrorhamnose 3,5-epimerase
MLFTETYLKGSFLIAPKIFEDNRGIFHRIVCKNIFEENGLNGNFVQINHSRNFHRGTVRGLHFQKPPFSENKLVKCIKGKVLDVIVDIRKNSVTFGKWFSTELSAEENNMIYIPEGFAHGFQTLEDESEILYFHTQFYTPEADAGLRYNDPFLNIKWTLPVSQISDKDASHALIDNNFQGITL